MKQKILKVLSAPKIVVGVVSVVALVAGGVSYALNKSMREEWFAKIKAISQDTVSASSSSPRDLTLAFAMGGRIKNVFVKTGDVVPAGTVLASLDAENAVGAINQAKAAYLAAQTAYDKLLNGASTPDIGVSQAAVNVASTALNNAEQNLIRDLSLAYNNVNSIILLNTNALFSNPQSSTPMFGIVGLVQTNNQLINNINSERLEINNDLSTWQNEVSSINQNNTDVVVAHSLAYMTKIRSYLTDMLNTLTSYTQVSVGGSQLVLTESQQYVTGAKVVVDAAYTSITNDVQAIKSAKSSLDQANAALTLKESPARVEDIEMAKAQVESTQGALQVAQGAYNNTIITAPFDGKIINVAITAGQIATPGIAAIEILSK